MSEVLIIYITRLMHMLVAIQEQFHALLGSEMYNKGNHNAIHVRCILSVATRGTH